MGLEAEEIVAYLLRHRLRFVAVAGSIVRQRHDADDIFQQVVLKALLHKSELTDTDHLLGWALRTTKHKALDLAKRKHLHTFSDRVLELLETHWADRDGPTTPDRVEALWSCLTKLTSSARTVLKMKYFDAMPVPLIAEAIQRTPDAVYQILSRTHRALKSCVEIELNGSASEPRLPSDELRRVAS